MLANFIIIGAPKAGTTALYWYLAEHPQVFMSPVKETNYFAYGRDDAGRLVYGDPKIHHFPVRSESEYEDLFENAGNASAIGEASPMYLECPASAARIRDRIPDAKIICALRNPVDRAWSDYLMYLRQSGRRFDAARDLAPDAPWMQPDSHWVRVSHYHDALRRYFDRFPREQVHVFLFDDLRQDPRRVVQEVYRFLGVDASYVPDFDTPYNTGGLPANRLLERVFNLQALKHAVEPLLPRRAMNRLRQLRASNLRKPPALPAELRAQLGAHFRDDIHKTAELIKMPLDAWLEPVHEGRIPAASVASTSLGSH
ncbi:MAG TPA: sulfotransferase [Gammaproteobacteria bacterium]